MSSPPRSPIGVSPPPAGYRPPPRRRRAVLAAWPVLVGLLLAVAVATAAFLFLAGPPAAPAPTGDDIASQPTGSPSDAGALSSPATQATPGTMSPTATRRPTASPTVAPDPTPQTKEPPPTSAPPEELTGYTWPIVDARITSRFGPRDFGGFVVIDGREVHDGLDLATFCGNKVRAAHDGTVLHAGRRFDDFMGYLGNGSRVYERLERQGRMNTLPIVVVIDDGNGYRSVYVHLSEARVEAGERVAAGDVIGLEGATGYATGCHLHYTLIRMDGPWQVVVPQLHPYGYPPFARERVNPLDVLPHDHPDAPIRLRNKFASPSPDTPAATDSPSAPASAVPTDSAASPTPGDGASPAGSPSP